MPEPNFEFFLATEASQRVQRALGAGTAPARLLLRGDAGLGKAATVLRAVRELDPEALLLHGTPSPLRAPYYPFAEALSALVERASRNARVRDAAVGLGADLLRLVPVLGTFSERIIKTYGEWGVKEVAPIAESYDIVYQVQKILGKLAEKRRVVALFEDVATYDSASLALLAAVLKNRELAFTCVLTLDPVSLVEIPAGERERFERFEAQAAIEWRFRTVEFRPFTPDETRAFLDGVLYPHALSAEQVRAMHDITGGNLLFLKELLTHLLDEAVLSADDGVFRIPAHYPFDSVPRSISQLIGVRLGRLQDELKEVINVAAVLGLEFSPHPITGMLKLEHLVTLRRLRELEATHRLISETTRSHAFTYRSVRDRLYAELGPAMARYHHVLIARYLEEYPCLDDNEHAVYHHFAQAGDSRSGLPHLRNAAYESRSRLRYAEAAERFREAARLTREMKIGHEEADELLLQSALAAVNAGLFPEALHAFEWLAHSAVRRDVRATALLQLGLTQWIGDGPEEAGRNLNLLLVRHAGELDGRTEVEARLGLASVLYHVGEWETAWSHYRKCFRAPVVRADPLLRARARRCINMFYTAEMALPLLRESLRDLEEHRHLPLYWEIRHNIACNHLWFGELAEARRLFEEVLEWFDGVGTYRAIFTDNDLGIIALAEGDYDEAERRFRRVGAAPVSPFEAISAECQLALVQVFRGDPGGLRTLESLVPRVVGRPEHFIREMVFHNLGWAQMQAGRGREAARTLLRGIPERRTPTSDFQVARTHRLLRRLRDDGIRVGVDVDASPQLALLEGTGRKDAWWWTALDCMCNDLWCWE